jgi:hypothetical protein
LIPSEKSAANHKGEQDSDFINRALQGHGFGFYRFKPSKRCVA